MAWRPSRALCPGIPHGLPRELCLCLGGTPINYPTEVPLTVRPTPRGCQGGFVSCGVAQVVCQSGHPHPPTSMPRISWQPDADILLWAHPWLPVYILSPCLCPCCFFCSWAVFQQMLFQHGTWSLQSPTQYVKETKLITLVVNAMKEQERHATNKSHVESESCQGRWG